jgi:hypothetical protein
MSGEPVIPIVPGRFYTAVEVSLWLRHPVEWFYRYRRTLEKKGFPPAAVPVGQPRWRGDDLLAWDARRCQGDDDGGAPVIDLSDFARQRGAALLKNRKRRAS